MKVFCLEGVEFYAAKNWRDAVRYASDEFNAGSYFELLRAAWREIPPAELENNYIFFDNVDDDTGEGRSFAAQLQKHIDAGDTFPLFLASTDH